MGRCPRSALVELRVHIYHPVCHSQKGLEQLSKKINKLLIFLIALFLSLCAFLFIPLYAQITEGDDVFVAGAAVIPTLFVSIALCLILIKNRLWIFSLILTTLNSFNALLVIYITHEAIIEILSSTNKIYDGKVKYTSLDLFTIGIIPAILVVINWIILFSYLIIILANTSMTERKKQQEL